MNGQRHAEATCPERRESFRRQERGAQGPPQGRMQLAFLRPRFAPCTLLRSWLRCVRPSVHVRYELPTFIYDALGLGSRQAPKPGDKSLAVLAPEEMSPTPR